MATVWVALTVEAVVLMAVAGTAIKWVRQDPVNRPDQLTESVTPLLEKSA